MSTAKKRKVPTTRGETIQKRRKRRRERESIGQGREENGKEEWTQTRMYRNRYERFMSGL